MENVLLNRVEVRSLLFFWSSITDEFFVVNVSPTHIVAAGSLGSEASSGRYGIKLENLVNIIKNVSLITFESNKSLTNAFEIGNSS